MAIKLPSHLHRAPSGVLHFRIAIPPDVQQHFRIQEIYRSLRTANVRDAALAAQALSYAAKRLFLHLRQHSMSDEKKMPQTPFGGFEMGLMMELHLDDLTPSKKVIKIQTEPGDTPEIIAAAMAGLREIAPLGAAVHSIASTSESQNISAYVEPYFDSLPLEQRPNEKSLDQYRASIRTFLKIVGDKPLLELNRKDRNGFEDVVKKMPANSTQLANTRDLSIDGVIALGLPPMSLTNAKNIARRTNTFLAWAFDRHGKDAPFQLLGKLKVAKRAKNAKARRPFTDDELRLVFNAETIATGSQAKPYMFWVPLIAVHSGMRINEISQLLISDLVVIGGITCFNVTDEPDPSNDDDWPEGMLVAERKSLKTNAAKRLVPIHPALLDLGLSSYVEMLRHAGHSRLLPDLSADGRDGPGQAASKQFGRYLDRINLKDTQLVFHSFRHGVVSRLRRMDVPRELRKLLVGHSTVEDTHDSYGLVEHDYSTERKLDAIKTLNFSEAIDYAALKKRTPTLADLNKALRALQKPAPT